MTTTTERKLTTQKAIAEAVAIEMQNDESVFVMGEDVGVYGGIFGATEGLLAKFGPERIIDTPISETGFIGAAIGAAINGMRPVVELMFVDFFGVCMDQIYNNMAKIHYFSGGNIKVPVVLTTAVGGGYSDAGQHSQTLWGTFAHLPGMKVVVPSNPYDAKGLMIAAIRDDNPVVYMFHKGVLGLGWMTNNPRATGVVPEGPYEVPIGKANVVREGSDLTIATIGLSVHRALDAAEVLAAKDVSAEVLDLRSLVPLDRDAIVASVKKTHRLLVVDEDYHSFGMTGEVIATCIEGAFDYLDAPPARVATPDIPIPYSHPLETWALP
ncbi:MAG TPA: alpha-ketoacid dehydrogenase subunit beta, partial [Acidimicrobiia bacterium]|nr:alpha-ketoacid dehydrogenase subunit beta [Acidimicrobiia bacterium]